MATLPAALPGSAILGIARLTAATALGGIALLHLFSVPGHAARSPAFAAAFLILGAVQSATALSLATARGRKTSIIAAVTLAASAVLLLSAGSATPALDPAGAHPDHHASPVDYLRQHGDHVTTRP